MHFLRIVAISSGLLTAIGPVSAQNMPWEQNAPSVSNAEGFQFSADGPAKKAAPWSLGGGQTAEGSAGVQFSAPAETTAKVDESALRYYASTGQIARASAEIRRLKAAHPEWEPSQEIFERDGTQVDEQPLWDLFASKKHPELYAKIRHFIKIYPGYRPSSELTKQILLGEARQVIVHASEAKNFAKVIEMAGKHPELLVCSEIDMLWRTAEALASTGKQAQSFDAYRYILANCTNEEERRATFQKASTLFSEQVVMQLAEFGQTRFDGSTEFSDLRLDFVRRRVGGAAGGEARPVSQRDLEALEASATQNGKSEDSELLGWYYYSVEDFDRAGRWFQMAYDQSDSIKSVEGMVLSLRQAGKLADAEELAYRHRDADPLIRKAYLEVVMLQLLEAEPGDYSEQQLAHFASEIDEAKSFNAAQVLGWYLFEGDDLDGAQAWFEKSADYEPNVEAIIGQIVVAQRQKKVGVQDKLVAKWSKKFPAVAELELIKRQQVVAKKSSGGSGGGGGSSSFQRALRSYKNGDYASALSQLQARAVRGQETTSQKLLRGWALYHNGKWADARKVFKEVDGKRSSKSSRQGVWFSTKAQFPGRYD